MKVGVFISAMLVSLSASAICPNSATSRAPIAVIIDDLGYSQELAHSALALEQPIALSILPNTPFAFDIAQMAATRGKEVLIHLPMQAVIPAAEEPAMMRDSDSPATTQQLVEQALRQIPGAVGVNNHMGSALTANPIMMTRLMSILDDHELFFVDSRTSADTIAAESARLAGLKQTSRNVFLDNDLEPAKVAASLERLLAAARSQGGALAIGHPHEVTFSALSLLAQSLPEDIVWVSVDELIDCQSTARTSTP